MEFNIVNYLNHLWLGTFVDKITEFISLIPFIIVLWATLAIFASLTNKKYGFWIFATVLIALALHFAISEGIFKHLLSSIFFRERPWVTFSNDIIAIGKQFTDSSFPSSHMASTLAVLIVLVYYYKKVWPWALIFVLIMAFSRMHNGMHYLSDVLMGSFLGIIYGLLAIYIVKKIRKENPEKIDG